MASSRRYLRAAVIFLFFGALWLGLWRQLSGEWSVNDQYSYGWFVPFFAVVLFWLRFEDANFTAGGREPLANRSREAGNASPARTSDLVKAERFEDTPKTREDPPSPGYGVASSGQRTDNREPIAETSRARAIAIIIASVALLLLFPIRLFEIANPDWRPLSWLHALCAVAITLVFLWRIGGQAWLRHFAFPVVFTLVAVPWVTPIEQPIVQGLMRVVAAIASEAVALFGIPARLEGHLIRIPDGLVGVNEACSGVRSLQTSLMIGLLFGELKRLSILRRTILIVVAIAIAFIGNCIRAFFLVWVAATQSSEAANRWHDFAGYGIVALVFLGTLILAVILARSKKQRATEDRGQRSEVTGQSEIPNSSFVIGHWSFLAAVALVWLVFVEFAAASWYRSHERNLVQTPRWNVQWPRSAPRFHEIKIEDDVRRILRFDEGHAATWNLPAETAKPLICTLYFFRWNSGKNSALLANLHRPDVCLPAIGWNQTGDVEIKKYPVAPDLFLPFRHFEFRHGSPEQPTQQTAHAFYCLWEDRVTRAENKWQLPDMNTSPSAGTRDERMRAVLEGRRHLGQQVLELVIQTRGAADEKQIEEHFAAVLPTLIQAETGK